MSSTVRSNNSNDGRRRADQRSAITVMVLGDEGCGKSSLISTFVSRYFSEVVPGIMTRVRLPPDPHSSCITTIVDSQGADAALLSAVANMSLSSSTRGGGATNTDPTSSAATGGAGAASTDSFSSFMHRAEGGGASAVSSTHQIPTPRGAGYSTVMGTGVSGNVDSIILVYDLDRVETFFRLENHWLPLIERCYNGELPVIIAGNKMDLFRTSSTAGMTDEQALARSRQQIVSLMQRFTFVRQCIKCSAKNLLRVDEVFLKAQQAVLYPFTPLYDLENGGLTAGCRRAFTRIFRMYDADNDGLLSDAELDQFHREAFRAPVIDRDFAAWKKVITRNNPTQEVVVKDGKFTIPGFLAIFDVFISQNRLDVVWQCLRKFGYDDDLRLDIPDSVTEPEYYDRPDENWRLTPAARMFLTDLFHQFDRGNTGKLSGDDLMAIFSILPEPALPPWHAVRAPDVFKDCAGMPKIPTSTGSRPSSPGEGATGETVALAMSQSLSASGITILSSDSVPTVNMANLHSISSSLTYLDWMGCWHTMASISPSVTRAELYRLGHVENPGKRDGKRRGRRKGAVAPAERTPDSSLLSREIRVLVLGGPTSGSTDLVNSVCGLDGVDSSAYLRVNDPKTNTYPESCSAHIKMKRKVAFSKKSSRDESGGEFVLHLIFTEFSQMDLENAEHKRELAEHLGEPSNRLCDLVVLAFDTSDEKSLSDVKTFESTMLEDDLPRVYVGIRADSDENNDEERNQPISVVKNATSHCRELDLEPPLVTSSEAMLSDAGEAGLRERRKTLDYFARCARLNEVGVDTLRSKPHEEMKRQEAARRKKLIWFGGLVSVSVVVAAGVGLFLRTSGKGERRARMGWITNFLFGTSGDSAAATN